MSLFIKEICLSLKLMALITYFESYKQYKNGLDFEVTLKHSIQWFLQHYEWPLRETAHRYAKTYMSLFQLMNDIHVYMMTDKFDCYYLSKETSLRNALFFWLTKMYFTHTWLAPVITTSVKFSPISQHELSTMHLSMNSHQGAERLRTSKTSIKVKKASCEGVPMLHVKRRKWSCYSQNADQATINLGDDNLLPTFELHCLTLSTQLNIKYTVLYTSSSNGWRISFMVEITFINCMQNCRQCEAKTYLCKYKQTKSSYSHINKTQSLWSCWKVNEKDRHSLVSEIYSTSFLQLFKWPTVRRLDMLSKQRQSGSVYNAKVQASWDIIVQHNPASINTMKVVTKSHNICQCLLKQSCVVYKNS